MSLTKQNEGLGRDKIIVEEFIHYERGKTSTDYKNTRFDLGYMSDTSDFYERVNEVVKNFKTFNLVKRHYDVKILVSNIQKARRYVNVAKSNFNEDASLARTKSLGSLYEVTFRVEEDLYQRQRTKLDRLLQVLLSVYKKTFKHVLNINIPNIKDGSRSKEKKYEIIKLYTIAKNLFSFSDIEDLLRKIRIKENSDGSYLIYLYLKNPKKLKYKCKRVNMLFEKTSIIRLNQNNIKEAFKNLAKEVDLDLSTVYNAFYLNQSAVALKLEVNKCEKTA